MQKNLDYFLWRDKNPKFKNKPCYVENKVVEWFCDRLIYCLNEQAKTRFKYAFGLEYEPDFVCIYNCTVNHKQFSIKSRDLLKTSYVLFKFDENNKPRIIRRHDWSFRWPLKEYQYATPKKTYIYPTKEFAWILFSQDFLYKNNFDATKTIFKEKNAVMKVPLHSY